MSPVLDLSLRALLVGAGATAVMDLWAAALRRAGVASLDLGLLGRWVAHLPRGRWFHADIARTPPVRGERPLGWAAHYAIGVGFAALLLWVAGPRWADAPTLAPALTVGVVGVLAPWCVLQPALGAGLASSRTRRPAFNALKSLVTHTVFGVGLYLAALATAALAAATR